eukprot:g4438.t1
MDLLEDEAPALMLVGSCNVRVQVTQVLMEQDLEEVKQNVAKRLGLKDRDKSVPMDRTFFWVSTGVSSSFQYSELAKYVMIEPIVRIQGGVEERTVEETRKIMQGAASKENQYEIMSVVNQASKLVKCCN